MGPALRLRLSLSRPFLRAGGGLRPRVRGSPPRIRVGAHAGRCCSPAAWVSDPHPRGGAALPQPSRRQGGGEIRFPPCS